MIDKKMRRVIDANFNRAKEGLRVCEDLCRFFINQKEMTRKYKDVRHKLTEIIKKWDLGEIIGARDIEGDVGRRSSKSELQRTKANDIFYANSQRVKESIRVLEEFSKIFDRKAAENLKKLRYKIYSIEKDFVRSLKKFL